MLPLVSSRNLASTERQRLCDLALEVGAEAPTLCGDWTVQDLVAHLLVRERNPIAASGIWFRPLGGVTEWAMRRTARSPLESLVARLRSPGLSPVAIPVVDRAFNSLEYYIHHEDIRRARRSWLPRELTSYEQGQIWAAIKVAGRGLVRHSEVPVTIRRSDKEASAVLKGGADPVVVTGLPGELALFLYGRAQHRGLTFDGPKDAVAALRKANLGI